MASSLLFLCVTALSSLFPVLSSALCLQEPDSFLYSLQSQCPPSISLNPPIQVDGNFIDKTLTSKQMTGYTSVLFYASLCPFSRSIYPAFEALSLMFPQIEHLAVEQSSSMPSVFSRYGIRSVPTMLMINQTSRVRYHGPKDLHSLVQFYEKTTGLEPVYYCHRGSSLFSESHEKSILQSMSSLSFKERSKREPYLVFSVLFLCLRLFLSLFPKALYCLKAFSASYIPHFKKFGNVWGDKANNGAYKLHDRCKEDLDQATTMQKQEFAPKGKKCQGMGFLGFCLPRRIIIG